ncbi:hypothetical protein D9M71_699520 [compost metagenome]
MGRFVGKEADGYEAHIGCSSGALLRPAPPWIGCSSMPSRNDLSGNEELAEGAAI